MLSSRAEFSPAALQLVIPAPEGSGEIEEELHEQAQSVATGYSRERSHLQASVVGYGIA